MLIDALDILGYIKYVTFISSSFYFCKVATKKLRLPYVTCTLFLSDRAASEHAIHSVGKVLLGASSMPGKVPGIRK